MKKTITLLLAFALLTVSFFAGDIVKSEFETVETCKLSECTQEYVIYAGGNLEELTQRDIVTDIPVIAKTIEVEIGEYVKYNQRLSIIDKEKTLEALTSQLAESTAVEIDSTVIQAISAMGIILSDNVQDILNQIQQEMSQQVNQDSISAELIPDEITAPISGYIVDINLSQDSLSSITDSVISIASSTSLVAKVSVNESNVPNIKVGMLATITGAGFDGNEYSGRITQIYPTARQVISGTSQETVVDVIIRLINVDNIIKSGYSVQAQIKYQEDEIISYIPYEAVLQNDFGQEYVYVFIDGQAIKKYIVTGRELSLGFEVLGGLTDKDIVIKSSSLITKNGQYIYLETKSAEEESKS